MTFKDLLDAARPHNIADAFRKLGLGTFLSGLANNPQMIETIAVSAHTCELTYPAQFLQSVIISAGSNTGPCLITGSAGTVASKAGGFSVVKFDGDTTLTFHATDAVTECKVQYLTGATLDASLDAESGVE